MLDQTILNSRRHRALRHEGKRTAYRRAVIGIFAFGAAATLAQSSATAAESAVILMYHRFGETKFPSTNIRLEQFEAHIDELKKPAYTVLPVPEILEALRSGKELPERTVGLTVDDGYRSVFTEAWPRLKAARFSLTVFIATDPIDRRLNSHMSWDQVRELRDGGVTIGAHTVTHNHMAGATQERNRREIEQSNARMTAELGQKSDLFAFPYGEASSAVQRQATEAGYRALFGQHSGVVHRQTNFGYLPRFAMNERFSGIGRFRLVINALPLPAADITPVDPTLKKNNPNFGAVASAGKSLAAKMPSNFGFEVRLGEPSAGDRESIARCPQRTADFAGSATSSTYPNNAVYRFPKHFGSGLMEIAQLLRSRMGWVKLSPAALDREWPMRIREGVATNEELIHGVKLIATSSTHSRLSSGSEHATPPCCSATAQTSPLRYPTMEWMM